MNSAVKQLIKTLLPKPILDSIRKKNATWTGNYSSWSQAKQNCSGYDQGEILKKVEQATSLVTSGKAVYERDSVTFESIDYSWPTLAGLLWANSIDQRLEVLDFGGSLGSSYYQNRKFLSAFNANWNVVEQANFVELANAKFRTESLRFFETAGSCISTRNPNVLFISSTLQYLEDPLDFLTKLVNSHPFSTLIFDRLSIIKSDSNRLTKQTVPESIYKASYPAWFFSEKLFLSAIPSKYKLIEKFDSSVKNETYVDGNQLSNDYGFIFRLTK